MSNPDMAHSDVVGGSSAARVMNCPGSVHLLQKTLARPSSSYAEEGTALHLAMEHILRNDLVAEEVLGMEFHGHEMTREYVDEALDPAVRYFEKVVGDFPFEIEVRAPLKAIDGAFGTADIVFYDEAGLLGILDWKFGAGQKVSIKDNMQMKFYLQAQLDRGVDRVEGAKLEAHIVQPRMNNYGFDTYRPDELAAFAQDLKAALAKPEVFKKGAWCHFCDAKRRCPEMWGRKARSIERAMKIAG